MNEQAPIAEKYITNGTGQIHVLSQVKNGSSAILMISGMFGTAEHWSEEFEELQQYSTYAMSVRGRGKSLASFSNYSFSSQVSDVIAVIDSCPEQKITLLAHSYGCLFAVAACDARKDRIAGLILVDKGLAQKQLSEKWLQNAITNPPSQLHCRNRAKNI